MSACIPLVGKTGLPHAPHVRNLDALRRVLGFLATFRSVSYAERGPRSRLPPRFPRDELAVISFSDEMDNDRLGELIQGIASAQACQPGFWRFEYCDREVWVVTDEAHDRMRVMSPVIEADQLSPEVLRTLLAANFDRALDAKYALTRDYLWSLFMHPLRELSEAFFLDALRQVTTLAENFGSTFASSDLIYGDSEAED